MAYRQRINNLHEKYADLEKQISNLRKASPRDDELIFKLLNQQHDYMTEIKRLNKLQWEIDHETVNLDDDR